MNEVNIFLYMYFQYVIITNGHCPSLILGDLTDGKSRHNSDFFKDEGGGGGGEDAASHY